MVLSRECSQNLNNKGETSRIKESSESSIINQCGMIIQMQQWFAFIQIQSIEHTSRELIPTQYVSNLKQKKYYSVRKKSEWGPTKK